MFKLYNTLQAVSLSLNNALIWMKSLLLLNLWTNHFKWAPWPSVSTTHSDGPRFKPQLRDRLPQDLYGLP